MKPPRQSPLLIFFLAAIAWLLLLTVAWTQVSAWTSRPVGFLAHMALELSAKDWVRSVSKKPEVVEIETRLPAKSAETRPGMEAMLVVEGNPSHYAYGLPLLLALLLASGGRRFVRRALAGYLLLLPFQAFSLTMDLVKQMAFGAAGGVSALGISQWQLEAIALGYQAGSLMVPTLAPVLLWLWFEKAFFASVILDGWLRRQSAG